MSQDLQSEAGAFFLGASLPGLLGVFIDGSQDPKQYQLAVEQVLDRFRKTSQNDIHTMAYWARGIELCLEYRSLLNQIALRYIVSGTHPEMTDKVDDTTRQKYEGDRWRLFCSIRPGMTELAYILERIENTDVMAYCAYVLASYASVSPSEDDISLAKSLRVRFTAVQNNLI